MHSSPHPKNTPGRRRSGRNGNSKNYASENDAASYRQAYSDSPSTPQRLAAGDALAVQNSQTTASKQRKHSQKGRSKNGAASPGLANGHSAKQERQSPSFPPNQIPAFAGATFHHSPAPSALPIPSFLARTTSAPDSPSQKKPVTTGPSQEPSPPTTDSESDGPGSPQLPSVPRNEESPLEIFFKAQRAEKSGTARRASSANINAVPPGPFSPPHDSPKECQTMPRMATLPPQKRPPVARMPSSGISATELDGTPGKSLGPAFSTPYSERIKAARPSNGFAPTTPTNARNLDADRSDALKRYLFSGAKGGPQQPQTPPRQQPKLSGATQTPPKLPRGMFPASVLNGGGVKAPPVQSPPPSNSQSSDQMRHMEDSLRRLLKMDSAT
ncbi:uncharacterized protein PG998_007550 [Apiospora kogelbergensis]|uniref:Proteophosphoglycan 5 n=1 Tax=Apiospora kogelbergensis TaxID=1337665 RepID=A0AAW0QPB0_9PEZI